MAAKRTRVTGAGATARQPTPVDQQIGLLIRERRLELLLNLVQLAERVGIAVQQLQKYETGENRVSASRLVDIARELSVPVAWFFERAGALDQTSEGSRATTAAATQLLIIFDALGAADQQKLIEIAKLLAR